MAGNLDWLYALEAAGANTYGDNSKDVIARLLSSNSNAGDLLKSGAITDQGGVNWNMLPKAGPGGDLPPNSMLFPVSQRIDPYTLKPAAVNGPVYNDQNYGPMALIQKRAPDDPIMKIGRALTLALVGGGIGSALAPAIGGAFGFGSGANSTIAALLKALPGLIQSGGGNWGSVAGSLAGGATGIPFGSTVGGMVGGQFNRPGG